MTEDAKNFEGIESITDTPIGNAVPEHCDGCSKKNEENICTVYHNPASVCRLGCGFSEVTKNKLFESAEKKKTRSGQQKQTKKKK